MAVCACKSAWWREGGRRPASFRAWQSSADCRCASCCSPAAADASVEAWEPVAPPPAANASANATGNSTDGAAAAAPAPAVEEPLQLRKRAVKVPLNVTGGFFAPGMNKTELDVSVCGSVGMGSCGFTCM